MKTPAQLGRELGRRIVPGSVLRALRFRSPVVDEVVSAAYADIPPAVFRCGACGDRVGRFDPAVHLVPPPMVCETDGELEDLTPGELATRRRRGPTVKLRPVQSPM